MSETYHVVVNVPLEFGGVVVDSEDDLQEKVEELLEEEFGLEVCVSWDDITYARIDEDEDEMEF